MQNPADLGETQTFTIAEFGAFPRAEEQERRERLDKQAAFNDKVRKAIHEAIDVGAPPDVIAAAIAAAQTERVVAAPGFSNEAFHFGLLVQLIQKMEAAIRSDKNWVKHWRRIRQCPRCRDDQKPGQWHHVIPCALKPRLGPKFDMESADNLCCMPGPSHNITREAPANWYNDMMKAILLLGCGDDLPRALPCVASVRGIIKAMLGGCTGAGWCPQKATPCHGRQSKKRKKESDAE